MDGDGSAGRRAAAGGRDDRSAEVERPRGGRGRHRNGVARATPGVVPVRS